MAAEPGPTSLVRGRDMGRAAPAAPGHAPPLNLRVGALLLVDGARRSQATPVPLGKDGDAR